MGAHNVQRANELPLLHPTLGEVYRVKDSERWLMRLVLEGLTCTRYEIWRKGLQRSQINRWTLRPLCFQFKEKGLCGEDGTLQCIMPYLPHSLAIETQKRYLRLRYYAKGEVYLLMFCCCAASTSLANPSRRSIMFAPEHVLLSPDGEPVLITQHSLPFIPKHTSYKAPELSRFNNQFEIDVAKVDCYAAGMLLLHAACLQQIDPSQVEDALQFVRRQYGEVADLLKSMTEDEPANRCTCSDVFSFLKRKEREIVNLEPFQPEPWKMEVSVTPRKLPSQFKLLLSQPHDLRHTDTPKGIFTPTAQPHAFWN